MDSISEYIIEIKKLNKSFKVQQREKAGLLPAFLSVFKRNFKTVNAVTDLDLSIMKGEIRGLIGPNGAGKSTTIKILSGILYPDSGEVRVMEYTPWKKREQLVKQIGVVLGQKSQLIWDLPAIDTFHLHKKMYQIPDDIYSENINFFSELLDMSELIKKPVRQLSLGERMKCEFICALLHEPPLVFLDEPTIGLDVFSREAIRLFIKNVNKDKGTTFIVTTHDLDDIENLCDNVSIINRGAIVFDDKLSKLKTYFTGRKIIELQFSENISKSALDGFRIIEFSDLTARLEIDTENSKLDKIVSELFGKLPVQDININNISIEEVIKHIYSS